MVSRERDAGPEGFGSFPLDGERGRARGRIMGEAFKQQAAERALAFVEPGMKLGLGTGSTAAQFVARLGVKVQAGLDVVCVATSQATRAQAEALGIPLTTLDETPFLDLTIDG